MWARRPGAALNKAGPPLLAGLWLGRDSRTDEHIVATGAGVFRTRTVKRRPRDEAWDKAALSQMRWTPWDTGAVIRGRPPRQKTVQEPIISVPLPRGADAHEFRGAAAAAEAGGAAAAGA